MEKQYVVQVTYPDGHTEQIEEIFKSGREALEYGAGILSQIAATEQFHGRNAIDEFGDEVKKEAYFIIIEVVGKKHSVVYDSRYNH